ncbi:MAG: hypothetical protein HYY08_00650 [Firmicutes bacterium]|nr:hypothetical protein [Bacillota bacterium]
MTIRASLVRHPAFMAVMLLSGLALLIALSAQKPRGQAATKRVIHMSAVEYKGTTTVDKEPFPGTAPPPGGGYVLKPPVDGKWETSTYRFEPGFIVVNKHDDVELNIWGVNGDKHETLIEGFDVKFVVKRGQLTKVGFHAGKSGMFRIVCDNHKPSMVAWLVVLEG